MGLTSIFVGLITLFLAPLSYADSKVPRGIVYEEGTHYVELPIPIETETPDKIEVVEYFSYGCPHCYQFESLIHAWRNQLPKDVTFSRVPAVWNQDYKVYAQTYYAVEMLNLLGKTHLSIFNGIHNQRLRLNSAAAMTQFLSNRGIPAEDFARAYRSFGVRTSLQQADAKGRAYRAKGVPALIVNGKYLIGSSMAGSYAKMLQVADYLIALERKAMDQKPGESS